LRKKAYLLVILLLLVTMTLAACGQDSTQEPTQTTTGNQSSRSTLEVVKNRGYVIVGVNSKLPGFGYLEPDGSYSGFDVEFGRALAAAIFNDPNAVEFRPLSAKDRLTAVQTGEVDVLMRNTTWTISRDTSLGLNFAPTTFYDGQGMMVRKDSGINSLEDLDGARIGVQTGTTTELNLTDHMRKLNVDFEPIVFEDLDSVVAAYEAGSIDAWTTDISGLASRQATLADPNAHKVLPEVMSKEPLGPVVREGDDQWYDIVKWTIFATIEAEELGITQGNIDSFMNSDDPVFRRFLGVEGDLGTNLGLSNDFTVNIIKSVGNYGEIFDRYLGPDTVFNLERGLNDLWTNGGLMYAPPFR